MQQARSYKKTAASFPTFSQPKDLFVGDMSAIPFPKKKKTKNAGLSFNQELKRRGNSIFPSFRLCVCGVPLAGDEQDPAFMATFQLVSQANVGKSIPYF